MAKECPDDAAAPPKTSLYNRWLPAIVAERIGEEEGRFHQLALKLKEEWEPGNSASAVRTTRFIYLIQSFLKALSTVAVEDVQLVANIGLEVLLEGTINLQAQTRWAICLTRIFRKYRKKLSLSLDWRPFYKIFVNTHFKRQEFYSGLGTNSEHATNFVVLLKCCRYYFSAGSATEIWNEFRPCFDHPCRTSCLEALGFLGLFIPLKSQHSLSEPYVFTVDWVAECLDLWQRIPSCQFWSSQWGSLIGRCITSLDMNWEPFMPVIFSHLLNSFRVPVGRSSAHPPINWSIHSFPPGINVSLSKTAAKSIVRTSSSFRKLVDYLEPYYHPSNGGHWSDSLEHFMTFLVRCFSKRMERECNTQKKTRQVLGAVERASFVKEVLRLVERGQYSKSDRLSHACAKAVSNLAYIEPALALNVAVSSFETAMVSITATHQLELAIKTLALCTRPILLFYQRETASNKENQLTAGPAVRYRDALLGSMFKTIPGLDANDPLKTLATMQLYCSVLSSVSNLQDPDHNGIFPIDWEKWTFQFLDQLFSLLLSLEPGSQSSLSTETNTNDGFLVESGSYFYPLLALLFGKLPERIFKLVLVRIKKFLTGNILPGAADEMATLCFAAVERDSSTAISMLLEPIMKDLLSTLGETPSTGYCKNGETSDFSSKATLSSALEQRATYQLNVLASTIAAGDATILNYKTILKDLIQVAFNAPSCKVNDAGKLLLKFLIRRLVCYFPVSSWKICVSRLPASDELDIWIGTKDKNEFDSARPSWHIPSADEIMFVEELVDFHMHGALSNLQRFPEKGLQKNTGQEKDYLRVTLLRVDAVLQGLGSSLPDFQKVEHSYTVVGLSGVPIGDSSLRSDIAMILHKACGYLLANKGDESAILKPLISVMNAIVNSGGVENGYWHQARNDWDAERLNLTEPAANFLTSNDTKCLRRPLWLVHQRAYIQHVWRSAETEYYDYYMSPTNSLPPALESLSNDLVSISLHRYKAIRSYAAAVLGLLMHRFFFLPQTILPLLVTHLNNPNATEESTLGACAILKTRTVIRSMMEVRLTSIVICLCVNVFAHHDSTKAQNAINKLFIAFNWYFGGSPVQVTPNIEDTIMDIKSFATGASSSVHWRYNLMAQGLLLFLTLAPFFESGKKNLNLVRNGYEHFLGKLTSDLPTVRRLSVRAVLLLLGAESDKMQGHELNGSITIGQQLLSESFGERVVELLALDHHYTEDDGIHVPQSMSDVGLVYLLPTYMCDWPLTRSWESKSLGVAFSKASAKLFEELTRKYGQIVLDILRRPLEDAVSTVDERGKQCAAAEIIGGVIRSEAACVEAAWDDWLSALLRKALKKTTLECAPEWVACIRYATSGSQGSALRFKVLECLGKLLGSHASSSLAAKRFNFLTAALLEVQSKDMLSDEVSFQVMLLDEILEYTGHSTAQVRKAIGTLACVLSAGLRECGHEVPLDGSTSLGRFIQRTEPEARKILNVHENVEGDVSKRDKKAVKDMETVSDIDLSASFFTPLVVQVFYFLLACMYSGRFNILSDLVVELVHPLLLLQDTSEKDLTHLARSALRYLKWQLFPTSHLAELASRLLKAASEDNWRVRVASISFLQPFMYRHSFLLNHSLWQLLWNKVTESLCDPQLEVGVREMSSTAAAGMMRGAESSVVQSFREQALATTRSILKSGKPKLPDGLAVPVVHGAVLALTACILSVPYDIPRYSSQETLTRCDLYRISWLPEMVTTITYFSHYPWPIRATVTKAIGEFRRTHSDTWEIQKEQFTEEQLEVVCFTFLLLL
ncbi:hypothetical protein SELMODRAFT_179234 [Selaginella moellendorffii]|uniref:Proteasome activator subunit 4 n=1 Tax=Selaginella moellendorffii TaxID=88036 RepID=D8SF26_SELML|nr:hypothetical protein SELMODRAFT_179234 [Selaginella moellendorffii]